MSIISKIARRLGYTLARYTDSSSALKKIQALHPVTKDNKPLINPEQAMEALKSVGREPGIPSFTYYKRPERSSALMENLENTWWNAHGELIEKVWVFSENTNYSYRKAYVSRAAAFFRQGGKKAKILDLGCGSGWFGRMIADSELEYIGMDFSSTQIEIANKEKQRSSNKEYLNYYCLSDFRKIENIDTVTGIVIHAFLHHLYWEDLYNLFDELTKILPAGRKFFIMEPVYPGQNKNKVSIPDQSANNGFVTSYRANLDTIKSELIDKGLYDTKTESELLNVVSESTENGFFLSPKEVPFELGEFKAFLEKYTRIENIFHCGVLNLETAQLIERIKSRETQEHYSQLLFPFVNSLDAFLISNNYFEANEANYLFTAFECTLSKTNSIESR